MPEISGIDICRELKANPPDYPIHTIIVTVRSEKSDMTLALDSGADDFISKPYDTGELRARTNSGCRLLAAMVERESMLQNAQHIASLESLGLLAGGIAHNFNNLMGGVYGYIDMAKEEPVSEKVSTCLEKALKTIDRAKSLTAQLLTFAKGGAPIMAIGPLFPLLRETAQTVLLGTNVTCNFDVQETLWSCNFDKTQIAQAIGNIVLNAQQAMTSGGTIEFSAHNVSIAEKEHPALGQGTYVRISIKDHGSGITKENFTRVFEPFFTTKGTGRGLGLATGHSIITRHGGSIDVESEPGKGSTFHVFVPAIMENGSPSVEMSPADYASGRKATGTIF
jgi:signal transduction histidine kinase